MGIVTTDSKNYSNIADKIREKTATDATYEPEEMPSGIDDVYAAGQSSMVDPDKLIPKTVSGSYISVDDVSEIPHEVACKVESVNLLNPNAINPPSNTFKIQVTYSEEEDCFIFNGSATTASELTCETVINIPVNIGENVTLTTEYVSGTIVQGYGCVYIAAGNNPNYGSSWMNSHFLMTSTANAKTKAAECKYITRVWFYLYNNPVFENYKVRIKLNKGNALPYTPYVEPDTVQVTRTGKNMLKYPHLHTTKTVNGITFTDNGDGTVTANGTATADATYAVANYNLKKGTTYTFSGCPVGGSKTTYYLNPRGYRLDVGYGITLTPTYDFKNKVEIVIKSGTTVSNLLFKPQWELGNKATEYEPYVETQTLTPATDGTVEGMTSVSPYMNIFSDTEGVNIEATYNMSWGMQEERERFYNDFRQGKINVSISFEWLALDKASTTSIVDALSTTATRQTLTFNLFGVNKAFETASGAGDGSTSTEFAALVGKRTNWTIALK